MSGWVDGWRVAYASETGCNNIPTDEFRLRSTLDRCGLSEAETRFIGTLSSRNSLRDLQLNHIPTDEFRLRSTLDRCGLSEAETRFIGTLSSRNSLRDLQLNHIPTAE